VYQASLDGVLVWLGRADDGERMRSKRRLFCLLDFVLPVGNIMFPITNLMVDGGCIATTGGSSLFCISNINLYLLCGCRVQLYFVIRQTLKPVLKVEPMSRLINGFNPN
jgi:hypothetical protein